MNTLDLIGLDLEFLRAVRVVACKGNIEQIDSPSAILRANFLVSVCDRDDLISEASIDLEDDTFEL